MEAPYILHMLSPLRHVSPFDVNMALDAGFNAVIPYAGVELKDVPGLVQDAIFSRGPKGARRTGVFIGGRNAMLALDMLEAARKAMVPPFAVSVFADPAGSFTTAAAMVACLEKTLKARLSTTLAERRVAVFGATGVVGFSAGVIAAREGARVTLVGYDGPQRVQQLAEAAKLRFAVQLGFADGSTDALKAEILRDAEVVLAAGRAGVQILGKGLLGQARALKVAADVNAVPPAGIEGLGVQDDAAPLAGTGALGIGALTIGGVKYKVESGLFRRMIEADKPLVIDFRDAFQLAREIVG
ncbi:MAG: methylenetetrahydromethanopterin dehydrogenase [Rhodospirillaceae bacterium]|nr:methylenetetrahydromethanopterin dehydrogenase [Rhodospirillaceae bacterium]